ncbi:MAG: cell division protein ZapA [Alphaproteobacteria bacterium]|nr:cell division protein ZapA [Alphaproteobacteria bacterium]
MGKVTATINGRSYRLNCADGQEERLKLVAGYLGDKVDSLIAEFGQVGDDRLLAMAALMIADELFDAREGVKETSG